MNIAKSYDQIHVETKVLWLSFYGKLLHHIACQASVNINLVNVFAYGFHIKPAERE